jgi:predicted Zn-dependent protease
MSHSYLPQHELGVVATIFSLCALLVYAGAWLVRLLGDLPLSHP